MAADLTRVMRAAVPIPAVAAASVWHSAAVGGSVVGDVGPLLAFGEPYSCELCGCLSISMLLTPLAEVTP